MFGLKKFRPYLYGRKFGVVTDHQAIEWLNNLKGPTGRLARWAVKLGTYNYFIIHRPGKNMIAADTLSRNFNMEYFTNAAELFRHEQANDAVIAPIKMELQNGPIALEDALFFIQDGLVYRKWTDKMTNLEYKQILVPSTLRKKLLIAFHEHLESGHTGRDKTLDALKQRFYWKRMQGDVEDWVKTCAICQMKNRGVIPKLPILTIPPALAAFEFVAVDM